VYCGLLPRPYNSSRHANLQFSPIQHVDYFFVARWSERLQQRDGNFDDQVISFSRECIMGLFLHDKNEILRLAIGLLVARTRETNLGAALPSWMYLNVENFVLCGTVQKTTADFEMLRGSVVKFLEGYFEWPGDFGRRRGMTPTPLGG
jgi:hypothetical protein